METLEKNPEIVDLLETCNLNWSVRQEDVQTTSGLIIQDRMAIVRDDNDYVFPEIRSKGYHPFQNYELMDLLFKVSGMKGNLKIHNGGHFKGGARVYVQLKSNDLSLNGDKIEGYLTGINSFDGSTSLAFGPSNITISCQNKFFAAFRELDTKIRHTTNMGIKVDQICKDLEGVLQLEKEMFTNISRLADTRFDDLMKEKVTRALFKINPEIDLNDIDSIPGKTRNNLSRFYVDLDGELKQKGDNLWGLFSGVTKYTTHSLYKDKDSTENKMFDDFGKREKQIFNTLVSSI
jgi:hypothetical protein